MSRSTGQVSFEADGTRYTLVYSTNALCELEDRLGESVNNMAALATGGKRFRTIRTAFLCGLLDHHPNLTEKDAGRIMDMVGLDKVDGLVGDAFALAFPEVKAVPLALKPAAGKRAGRTG